LTEKNKDYVLPINYGFVGKDGKVNFITTGLNCRMTDFQAALGL